MAANLGRWIRRSATVANTASGDILRWVWRRSGRRRAQGKACAVLSLSVPGVALSLSLPGIDIDLSAPGVTIGLQDCSND